MPHGRTLLAHGHVLLRIVGSHHPFAVGTVRHAAYVEKTFCHVEIERIARNTEQLHQSQLDLLMSGSLIDRLAVVIGWVALEEYVIYVACALLRRVEPLAFARGLIICHGRFVHVSHVVEFVAVHNPRIGFVTRTTIGAVYHGRPHDMRFVEITVGSLCRNYDIDYLIHATLQLLIGLDGEQVSRSLHNLEQVGSHVTCQRQQTFGLLSPQVCPDTPEILHGRLGLAQRKGHKRMLLRLEAREPEVVLYLHFLEWYRLQSFSAFGIGGRAAATAQRCTAKNTDAGGKKTFYTFCGDHAIN